jgi:hypothetical protein
VKKAFFVLASRQKIAIPEQFTCRLQSLFYNPPWQKSYGRKILDITVTAGKSWPVTTDTAAGKPQLVTVVQIWPENPGQ